MDIIEQIKYGDGLNLRIGVINCRSKRILMKKISLLCSKNGIKNVQAKL